MEYKRNKKLTDNGQSGPNYISRLPVMAFGIFFNVAAMPNVLRSMAERKGLEFTDVSGMISFYQICYGLGAFILCYIIFNYSKKKILVSALLIFAVINLVLSFIEDVRIMIPLRAIAGFPASMVIPLSLTSIGEVGKKKGRWTSIIFLSTSIASMTGLFLSGCLGMNAFFIIPACLSIVSIFLIAPVKIGCSSTDISYQKRTITETTKEIKRIVKTLGIQKIFGGIFLNTFLITPIQTYMAFYLNRKFGAGKSEIAWILVFSVVGGMVGNAVSGKLVDKNKSYTAMCMGMILISVAIFTIKINNLKNIIPFLMFFTGAGRSLIHLSLVSRFVFQKSNIRPYVTSLNSVCVFISGSLGIFVFNWFQTRYSFEKYLGISAMIYIIGFVTVLLVKILNEQDGITIENNEKRHEI